MRNQKFRGLRTDALRVGTSRARKTDPSLRSLREFTQGRQDDGTERESRSLDFKKGIQRALAVAF